MLAAAGATASTVRWALRSAASVMAQSRALWEWGEPSTPTTMPDIRSSSSPGNLPLSRVDRLGQPYQRLIAPSTTVTFAIGGGTMVPGPARSRDYRGWAGAAPGGGLR